ncbi:hypothetical protein M2277_005641 [Paenibacillus sp. LBL]|nr:hypothetical protein [Paenibacillus sp. LBL]MDH6674942.1 hypothetical protein [Paenibacillus sp. LBL]
MLKKKNDKIISYIKKPKKISEKDQDQIIKENRLKREAALRRIRSRD